MDLKSAVLLCQLKNGFELRRKHSRKLSDVAEFSALKEVYIPSIFVESRNNHRSDGLEDVGICSTFSAINAWVDDHLCFLDLDSICLLESLPRKPRG